MSAEPASATASAFTSASPEASPSEIERFLHDRYALEGTVKFLASERDLTVHVSARDGRAYVLKVANAAEDTAIISFQNGALQHIAASAPEVPVPQVVKTREGESQTRIRLGTGEHAARLLTFLTGQQLYKSPPSQAQRIALGSELARLTLALKGFEHPASDHRILWDLKHVLQLVPWAEEIADGQTRRLVLAAFDAYREAVLPVFPRLRQQVVHNDFNPHNILVDPQAPERVTGILDFGDMVKTPLVFDLAVACAYQMSEDEPAFAAACELVGAYHAVSPLLDEELDLLQPLIMARNAMTIAITEWRALRYPANRDYILRNQPGALKTLRRYAALSPTAVGDGARAACARC